MVTLPNIGLKAWNLVTDPYDHAQLADNWAKMDQHDHTLGKGVPITTGAIADGAITISKLAVGLTAVPTDGSVGTSKLADGSVTAPKLASGAITTSAIALGAVTADDLADAAKLGLTDSLTNRRGFVTIATEESTASAAFVDLATVGPSVTVTVPTNGYVAILVECGMRSTGAKVPQVGIVESTDITSGQQVIQQDNATTITAWTVPGTTTGTISRAIAGMLVFPATSGARTYKLQYRSGAAGTCFFSGRKIWAAAFSN